MVGTIFTAAVENVAAITREMMRSAQPRQSGGKFIEQYSEERAPLQLLGISWYSSRN